MKHILIISLIIIGLGVTVSVIAKRHQLKTDEKAEEAEKAKSEFNLLDMWRFFTSGKDPETSEEEETTAEVIEDNTDEENQMDGQGIA